MKLKCGKCGWIGDKSQTKINKGCPECWRRGRYVPTSLVKAKEQDQNKGWTV
jgi:predicted  nucleic acid-binding Zn-ribbon protein